MSEQGWQCQGYPTGWDWIWLLSHSGSSSLCSFPPWGQCCGGCGFCPVPLSWSHPSSSPTPSSPPFFSLHIPMPGARCPRLLSPLVLVEMPVAHTCPGALWQPLAVPPALHPPAPAWRCSLWNSVAPCQAGWSKWSVRSSNRACFCSGAPCLSLELSFCSHCPWLFPSPSAREEEKSSTRRGVTKWMLLSSSSSAFLQHHGTGMLMPRGMLGGAGHILDFNDVC